MVPASACWQPKPKQIPRVRFATTIVRCLTPVGAATAAQAYATCTLSAPAAYFDACWCRVCCSGLMDLLGTCWGWNPIAKSKSLSVAHKHTRHPRVPHDNRRSSALHSTSVHISRPVQAVKTRQCCQPHSLLGFDCCTSSSCSSTQP